MIIPGSASMELAKKVAQRSGKKLAEVTLKQFPDKERYVKLPTKVEEAIIIQTLYPEPNDNLVELLLIADALEGKKTAVIPYYAYARQDKAFEEGEAVSAAIVAHLLKACGISRVITCDLHFHRKEGNFDLFGIPAYNITATDLLQEYVRKNIVRDFELITPDIGARGMVEGQALKKERLDSYRVKISGKIDVRGRNVVIIDDIITTGGTMLKAIEKVREAGAEKIIAACTHGAFVADSLEKVKSEADYVIATDSIQTEVSKVSIAGKIAELLTK
jgi:ribose-phosphate pyrophosphokinase